MVVWMDDDRYLDRKPHGFRRRMGYVSTKVAIALLSTIPPACQLTKQPSIHTAMEMRTFLLWNRSEHFTEHPFFGARTHLSAKTPNNRYVCFCCSSYSFRRSLLSAFLKNDRCVLSFTCRFFHRKFQKKGSVNHFFILLKSKRPSQVRKRECYDSESHSLFKEFLRICFVLV